MSEREEQVFDLVVDLYKLYLSSRDGDMSAYDEFSRGDYPHAARKVHNRMLQRMRHRIADVFGLSLDEVRALEAGPLPLEVEIEKVAERKKS